MRLLILALPLVLVVGCDRQDDSAATPQATSASSQSPSDVQVPLRAPSQAASEPTADNNTNCSVIKCKENDHVVTIHSAGDPDLYSCENYAATEYVNFVMELKRKYLVRGIKVKHDASGDPIFDADDMVDVETYQKATDLGTFKNVVNLSYKVKAGEQYIVRYYSDLSPVPPDKIPLINVYNPANDRAVWIPSRFVKPL